MDRMLWNHYCTYAQNILFVQQLKRRIAEKNFAFNFYLIDYLLKFYIKTNYL
jgi:hypothetical protein